MYQIGRFVSSPIFHTKMDGYSFQMMVKWSGSSKEKLGLYLILHRGDTPHEFLQEFDTEFTLRIHGRNGVDESKRFTQEDINNLRKDCFTIKKGEDSADKLAGCPSILTAPFEDFVSNNSLTMSCTLHL